MSNLELKEKIKTLLTENEGDFMDTLNEVLVEEWKKDEEEELLMINFFSSDFATLLKNKIGGEIGEKYAQSPSKFSTLLTAFVQVEIIEKSTDEEKLKEIENNPQALAGTKEIVRVLDKKGEEW